MVAEFMHVLESFGFTQHIENATHVLGHTLDLIMSYGFSIDNIIIEDACFSDHKPIVFNVTLSSFLGNIKTTGFYSRCINSLNVFSDMFHSNEVSTAMSVAAEHSSSSDYLIALFNSSCSDILDSIAPLKYKCPKFKSQPWLDDSTHSLGQICQKAERRWKKDHLTVSFEIFRESLVNFQKAAKIAKAKYYSDIINKHSHTPKILFSTINSIINPRISYGVEQSTVICERFLRLFVEKIAGIRSSFDPLCSRSLVDCSVSTDNLYSFQPVSLSELGDLVKQTKSSTSPYDVVPSDFLKEDFDTVVLVFK